MCLAASINSEVCNAIVFSFVCLAISRHICVKVFAMPSPRYVDGAILVHDRKAPKTKRAYLLKRLSSFSVNGNVRLFAKRYPAIFKLVT